MTIMRVKEAFAVGMEGGEHRVFAAGDLVDSADSVYQGREHLFEELSVAVDRKGTPPTSAGHPSVVERATAEPEEKRDIRPWTPVEEKSPDADEG